MNQILSVEMPKEKSKSRSNKANIKSVIIFFSIILILFAIILGIVAIMLSNKKSNKPSEENTNAVPMETTQATIDVEIASDSKLNIIVTCDKEISNVSYNWNGGDNVETAGSGQTRMEIPIDIPLGTNELNITVTDVEGTVTTSEPKQYTGSQGPSIVMTQQESKIKITCESEKIISYLSYNWDKGEEKKIEVNDTKAEQLVDVPEGEHTLYVTAEDNEGNKSTNSQKTIGDNKPELKVGRDRAITNFIIMANDDENLTKMKINLNGEDLEEITINAKEYTTKIPLKDGENKLIVTVYNSNGIENTKRVRITK